MRSKLMMGSAAVIAAGALAWAAKDPVVMKVAGVDVPKSEFEYLYHKNSKQQIEAQPLEEYVGMFELYKMKVADAKAEGLDTTSSFLSEMKQYRRELAAPYLADSTYLNNFVNEAALHNQEEVEVSHIMLAKARNAREHATALLLADSIRTALVNGADFEQLARKYSADPSVAQNGGNLGFISANRLPYSFEKAAYSLKPGELSDIVETSAGYHILKGGAHRQSRGSVRAAHIMKMVRPGSSPETEAAAKAAIDSLYLVVSANPDLFESVALRNSDDQGSARMGGQLGWFSTGMMVPEFSDVAFAMEVDEISKPVRSPYGWHIIKKQGVRGPYTAEELKPQILQRVADQRDERYKMVRDHQTAQMAKKHKGKENLKVKGLMEEYIAANGVDSLFYVTFGNSGETLFTIEGKNTPVSEFVGSLNGSVLPDSYLAGRQFEERYDQVYNEALLKAEEDWLEANNADYRNLLNEYRDGSLLYEVSLRKVWDKASQDVPGLVQYFNAHRSEYTWDAPKAKGILIQAKNDTVAAEVKARYEQLDDDPATAVQTLRQEFRNSAVADRVLASQGVNKIVDYLMFGGEAIEPNPKYPVVFMLEGKVIAAPEEMNDVKGQVTSDYQNMLEQNWTTELRRKYPVVRYDNELKKIK